MRISSPSEVTEVSSIWNTVRDLRVVRRALAFAVVVGSVLIAINYGDAILAGTLTQAQLIKMGLTVLVPYVVSTWSSVLALRGSD